MSAALWDPRALASGQGWSFRIGPLDLWIGRRDREWLVAHASNGDPQAPGASVDARAEAPEALAGQLARYVAADDDDQLTLVPQPADRPVVVRPERPIFVLPGERVSLYVSTPLWIRIQLARSTEPEKTRHTLGEVPVARPSDTWFGPSTLSGELAYASRTAAKRSLADTPLRPARAITRLRLANQGATTLGIERIAIPVRELDLVLAANGQVWTDGVDISVLSSGEAEVAIEPTAPEEAGASRPIGPARDIRAPAGVLRALSLLLG